MKEYKWSVGLRHKTTKAKLDISVWAPTCDDATHKLTGTGPDYDNGPRERDAAPTNH